MKSINIDGSDESSDWIHFMRFDSEDKVKKETKSDVKKFEIPDKFLEAINVDPKKMSPDQIKAMFAKLKEKGLLNDKPDNKKSKSGESTDKGSEDAQGSHPGLVKKKVTVRRNGKTSEEYRWVKSDEDEPTEKPKSGDEATGEEAGEVPGKLPEKPKGPVIRGLNKPDGEDEFTEAPHSKSSVLKDKAKSVEDATRIVLEAGWVFDEESDIFPDMSDFDSKRTPINIYTNDEGKLYGMSQFSIGDFGHDDDTAEIEYLEINTPMRGKGYGKKLMRDVVKTLLDRNCNNVVLVSLDNNSNKFYEAIGMVIDPKAKSNNTYTGDKEWMTKLMKEV